MARARSPELAARWASRGPSSRHSRRRTAPRSGNAGWQSDVGHLQPCAAGFLFMSPSQEMDVRYRRLEHMQEQLQAFMAALENGERRVSWGIRVYRLLAALHREIDRVDILRAGRPGEAWRNQ